MSEQTFLTGGCPQCGKALQVPGELNAFSCLYCGARLTPADLTTIAAPKTATTTEAELLAAAARLVECSLNHRGYQRNITRERFVPSFETFEAACAPIYRELEQVLAGNEAQRSEWTQRAVTIYLDDLAASWEKKAKSKLARQGLMDDDKVVIAIFLVPMVRKLALPGSEEFCQLLQAEWMRRYPQSPFYLGDYDSIADGFRKKLLGLCFITTAVCEQAGLPDDCAQLTAFRAFRDGYLRSCPDGDALIAEYYDTAPGIVTCIDLCEDRAAAYEAIRREYLEDCYADILSGRNEACKNRYTRMVRALQTKYLH